MHIDMPIRIHMLLMLGSNTAINISIEREDTKYSIVRVVLLA